VISASFFFHFDCDCALAHDEEQKRNHATLYHDLMYHAVTHTHIRILIPPTPLKSVDALAFSRNHTPFITYVRIIKKNCRLYVPQGSGLWAGSTVCLFFISSRHLAFCPYPLYFRKCHLPFFNRWFKLIGGVYYLPSGGKGAICRKGHQTPPVNKGCYVVVGEAFGPPFPFCCCRVTALIS
jgi:hypothetical protein